MRLEPLASLSEALASLEGWVTGHAMGHMRNRPDVWKEADHDVRVARDRISDVDALLARIDGDQ